MSFNIRISLIIFSIIWFLIIINYIRKNKLPVRYSIIWFAVIICLFLIAIIPQSIELIAAVFGFTTISNLVIGIILTLLLLITLSLTIIVSSQRKQIILLIQEVSILKKERNKNE